MKSLLFSTSFSLFTLFSLSAQFMDDFSDPSLHNPVAWQGDTQSFRIYEGQLQLFDQEASESNTAQLFTIAPSSLGALTTWQFYIQLHFSPSANNYSRLYLAARSGALPTTQAYYLQIGGISGNEDALVLYRQDKEGDRKQILSGQPGGVANNPVTVRVQITRSPDGLWSLETDYTGGYDFQLEDAAVDDTYNQLDYFGIYCRYTATRSDRFFFDDVFIHPLYQDTIPPELSQVDVLNFTALQLSFSEPIAPSSLAPENFTISGGIGQPIAVHTEANEPHLVTLRLPEKLGNQREYSLQIKRVEDLQGNVSEHLSSQFHVLIPESPQVGDLLLSEVLFHPQSGGEDFIEIFNFSDKVLDLNGLVIKNQLKLSGKTEENLDQPFILLPGQYLAITDKIADLKARYPIPDTALFLAHDLPTLEADQGNVSLFFQGHLLQSFDYSNSLHHPLLEEKRGVSLERLSFLLPENNPNNWVSATTATGYATPGYANSQKAHHQVAPGKFFELEHSTFSPNGDNFDDLLILNYQTERPGYLANIRVFDAQGRPVKHLSRNESLAQRGHFTWNGTNQEGRKVRTGVYILWIELFTPQGDKRVEKLICVLASSK